MNALVVAVGLLILAADEPIQAEVVIRNATIHDGTGAPGQQGDVAIRGDRSLRWANFRLRAIRG